MLGAGCSGACRPAVIATPTPTQDTAARQLRPLRAALRASGRLAAHCSRRRQQRECCRSGKVHQSAAALLAERPASDQQLTLWQASNLLQLSQLEVAAEAIVPQGRYANRTQCVCACFACGLSGVRVGLFSTLKYRLNRPHWPLVIATANHG